MAYSPLGSLLAPTPKRKVFVSYHHSGDQAYYYAFVQAFSGLYEVFQDKSLDRPYDSTNTDYVRWQIRQNDITGSSCTIVLCGRETPNRKYVDWEIKATLDKEHGLIGVALPTVQRAANGAAIVPDRLHHNVVSGYAVWVTWEALSAEFLKSAIEASAQRPTRLIHNPREIMLRNK
jgi:hypothetical protein